MRALAIREGDMVLPLNETSYIVLLPGLGLAAGLEIAERIKCSFTSPTCAFGR